jgi:hypothetical protein
VAVTAALLSGCSVVDCTTTERFIPAPGGTVTAIDRVISCGGAAGSLDEEILLAPTGADASTATRVVATTGPVYDLHWQDATTLVVTVDRVDQYGDPVSEYVNRYEQIRVVLKRV